MKYSRSYVVLYLTTALGCVLLATPIAVWFFLSSQIVAGLFMSMFMFVVISGIGYFWVTGEIPIGNCDG